MASDVWGISGIALDKIKRSYVSMSFGGKTDFQVRTTIVGTGPCLILAHDYMSCSSIQWHSYIEQLSQNFKVIMCDIGTYGANDRFSLGAEH